MRNPPPEESLLALEPICRDSQDLDTLRRVSRARDRVIKKGRGLGPRATNVGENYLQWVTLRVRKNGLPFRPALPADHEVPEPVPVLTEEVEEIKAALTKSEQEKVELQAQLEKALQENAGLRRENIIKGKRIVECEGRLEVGNAKCLQVQETLRGANEELQVRNKDRDRLINKAYAWEAQLKRSLATGKDLRSQLKEMESQLKGVTAEYEGKLVTERKAREVIRGRLEECQAALQKEFRRSTELKNFADYQEHIHEALEEEHAYLKEEYIKLNGRCYYFEERFAKLVEICNKAIEDVPDHLKGADIIMTRRNTPAEVFEFVEYMKDLIATLKIKARWPGVLKRKLPWMA